MTKGENKHIANISFITEIKDIITRTRQKAYTAINTAMVEAYWLMGQRIVEEEHMWSYRTLDPNIASQYYYRLLQSQNKQIVDEAVLTIYQY